MLIYQIDYQFLEFSILKMRVEMTLRGLKIRNEPFFSDPQMFFSQIKEWVKLGPLAKFERFLQSGTFLKKIAKVENRAKNLARPVGVGWRCVGGKLV